MALSSTRSVVTSVDCGSVVKKEGRCCRKIENVASGMRRKGFFPTCVATRIRDVAIGSGWNAVSNDSVPKFRVSRVRFNFPVGRNYSTGLRFKHVAKDWHIVGAGGDGEFPSGGAGGGGGGGGGSDGDEPKGEDGDDTESAEFGPLLKFEEVMREVESRGVKLPSDMLEAAKTMGIRKLFLENYLNLQGASWPLGYAMRNCTLLRNRMLADQTFLFKVATEVVIDSCCATFAEVQKRGEEFWSEFELYAADLLVGIVVDIALVGMLAPYARFGQPSASNGLLGRLTRASAALPSSVFEAERPGCKFSVKQRAATYLYKGVLYCSVGFACGLIGQGIANLIMTAKRSVKKNEGDIPVPPLVRSAALWGVFLAVSSNTRYQIVNGLERVVESSPVARRLPPVAWAFTVGIRFANNIYGGMQFVDWARWSGCQ